MLDDMSTDAFINYPLFLWEQYKDKDRIKKVISKEIKMSNALKQMDANHRATFGSHCSKKYSYITMQTYIKTECKDYQSS